MSRLQYCIKFLLFHFRVSCLWKFMSIKICLLWFRNYRL